MLPVNFFDHGKSISLFALIGVDDYYSKGLTKACMHLLHLDIQGAAAYNKLAFVVVPLIAVLWAIGFWKEVRKLIVARQTKTTIQNEPGQENKQTA